MALEYARPEERARHTGRIMVSNVRFLAAMVVRSFSGKVPMAMAHGALRKRLGDLPEKWSLLHKKGKTERYAPFF